MVLQGDDVIEPLRWAATGRPASWEARRHSACGKMPTPALLLPVTPDPWSYWIGLVHWDTLRVTPLILFKNAVPLFELTDLERAGPVTSEAWDRLVTAALMRNPGLRELLAMLGRRLPWSEAD